MGLRNIVLDSLAEKKGVSSYDYLYAYPVLFQLIKFVRNRQYHTKVNIPQDYRTGAMSFGNMYSFSRQLILSFYAYMEILEAWIGLPKNK